MPSKEEVEKVVRKLIFTNPISQSSVLITEYIFSLLEQKK